MLSCPEAAMDSLQTWRLRLRPPRLISTSTAHVMRVSLCVHLTKCRLLWWIWSLNKCADAACLLNWVWSFALLKTHVGDIGCVDVWTLRGVVLDGTVHVVHVAHGGGSRRTGQPYTFLLICRFTGTTVAKLSCTTPSPYIGMQCISGMPSIPDTPLTK